MYSALETSSHDLGRILVVYKTIVNHDCITIHIISLGSDFLFRVYFFVQIVRVPHPPFALLTHILSIDPLIALVLHFINIQAMPPCSQQNKNQNVHAEHAAAHAVLGKCLKSRTTDDNKRTHSRCSSRRSQPVSKLWVNQIERRHLCPILPFSKAHPAGQGWVVLGP